MNNLILSPAQIAEELRITDKKETDYKEKALKLGDDLPARDYLATKLEALIYKSSQGEIGIAEFSEELEAITKEAKEFLKFI